MRSTRANGPPIAWHAAKIASAKSAHVAVGRARHMKNPPELRCCWSFEQSPGHHENAVSDVKRIGRRAELVGHHGNFRALVRQRQHGADEVLPKRAVDPGGAENDVVGLSRRDCPLTGQLASPVDVHRIDRIAFDVRTIESAVENIVGRQLNDRYFQARSGGGDRLGPAMVDGEGKLGLRFREIHSGERGGVDHEVGLKDRESCRNCLRARKIDIRTRERQDFHSSRASALDQRTRNLSLATCDGDPHSAFIQNNLAGT